MNFEDIVAIIFVIIFFVGPLIKKIAEAAGKPEEQAKKGRSLEEVREYLERMKTGSSPSGEAEYRAPSTKPYKSSSKEKAKKKGVKEDVVPAVAAIAPIVIQPDPESTFVKREVEKNVLHEFMSNNKFTEVQKAVILAEIFKQPST